eukprot:scaffold197331_cov21-Tisochrysis_lutea.AAC.5
MPSSWWMKRLPRCVMMEMTKHSTITVMPWMMLFPSMRAILRVTVDRTRALLCVTVDACHCAGE